MEVSIKDRIRYQDISWMMPAIDLMAVLEKLGTKIHGRSGDRIIAFCPDHHLFVNRKPSHPRWLVHTKTGDTFCLTEGRGSNLVWTFSRMFNCSLSEAASAMLGQDADSLDPFKVMKIAILGKIRQITTVEEKPLPKAVVGLDDIANDLKTRPMSERAYQFFIHPPGKKYPTNIQRETVDKYQVFERTWGYYSDRVIIPCFLKGSLKGFVALDILGEEAWRNKHPLSDDYRKTMSALNFQTGEHLFGFDDCQPGAEYIIITEGPREVMKLRQEGEHNVVAGFGISITAGQMNLLTSLCPQKIVFMYDSDSSGVAAMDKEAKILSQLVPTAKCFIPKGRDPKNLDGNDIKILIQRCLRV